MKWEKKLKKHENNYIKIIIWLKKEKKNKIKQTKIEKWVIFFQ